MAPNPLPTPNELRSVTTVSYDNGIGRYATVGDVVPRGRRSHELGDCF